MTKKDNYLFDNIFAPFCDSEKIFLINDEYEISYLKFNKIVNQIANTLVSKGLKAGDRVAVQAEKSVIQIALYVATIKAGGIYLPLNTGYTTNELDYFINDSSSSIVIVDSKIENKLKEILDNQNIIFLTLNSDESGSLNESLIQQDENFDPVDRKKDDLAAILYTSGTTGKSKGAMLSHKNLVSNTNVLKEAWQYSSDDTLLHMLPIYHTHGLFVAFNLLAFVNGSIIFLPKFSTQDALKWMKKSTSMMGVPTFYTRLLE
jgi:malonyl-CoA/methylmalonyl-CoA synthetase